MKTQTVQTTLFDYFYDEGSFTLAEAENAANEILQRKIPAHSIRARIYEGVEKGLFVRVSKGVYQTVSKEGVRCLLINGNGRDLSMLKDNSIDAIITDHPYKLDKQLKGGNRNFATYKTFQYNENDLKEKFRVLKQGAFLVEFLPEENGENWEYLAKIKMIAKESGFQYYAKVSWIKGKQVNNTGRKSSNTEELLFFTKGKARNLRLDTKKNRAELLNHGISVRTQDTSQYIKQLLEQNNLPVHYMSGTNGMLPTAFVFEPPSRKERKHQAEKPVELIEEVERYITKESEWILDQFAGSFSVAKASLKQQRNSISIECEREMLDTVMQSLEEDGYEIHEIDIAEDFEMEK